MNAGRLAPILKKLDGALRDPLKLRIIVGVVMLGAWYGLFYMPTSERIAGAEQGQVSARTHLETAKDVEGLRAEVAKFEGRLPKGTDPNESVEYLLGGVRKRPLKVIKLEPQVVRKHGPFDVVIMKMELQGTFADLDALIAWIEVNPRLLRIDAIALEPGRSDGEEMTMRLTILGVIG